MRIDNDDDNDDDEEEDGGDDDDDDEDDIQIFAVPNICSGIQLMLNSF